MGFLIWRMNCVGLNFGWENLLERDIVSLGHFLKHNINKIAFA